VKLGYQTNTWGGVVGHPAGVTSIKDLFYLANGSTEQALADVAAAGYEGVELFDGNIVAYADDPSTLRRLLEQHELALVGVYSGANFIFDDVLEEELWRVDTAAALAAELGAEHLVVGGGAQRVSPATDEDYAKLGAGLDRVVAIAERHGLTPTFHPHMGTIVESPEQIRKVFSQTSIGFCPDTGHLILGGGDPVALFRELADRTPYVHLKDVTADGTFVPLGQGVLDLAGMVSALSDANYDGWIVVELDGWDDPKAGAQHSHRVLTEALG
jgi:inosose dehydratase